MSCSKFKVVSVFLCFFMLAVSTVFAQENSSSRRLEDIKRLSIDNTVGRVIKSVQRYSWEYGGWLNYQFSDYANSDNDETDPDDLDFTGVVDARWWFKGKLKTETKGEHTLYVRLKNQYWNRSGDNPGERYDIRGVSADYAYGIFDFNPVLMEVGRKYYSVGRGIVYSDVHDGVKLKFQNPQWELSTLLSHTLPHEDNIDGSIPGAFKESERYFYAAELTYSGIKNHELYSYFVIQKDLSDSSPESAQEYMYDSEYIGLGASGDISSQWHYAAEVIRQTGEGRVFTSNELSPVSAWAFDAEIEFHPGIKHNPKFIIEYAFGSGDRERVSVTDTEGGNLSGDDRNFLYFGYVPTGFVVSPRLSNLHMIKAATTWVPFPESMWLKRLTMGLDYYHFYKHKSAGGISDAEASAHESDIGSEVDINFEWKILSDLTLSVEYGHFMPSSGYADSADNSESFFSISLTHVF
jgi:hypothetical protein